jgi:ElaB/YqjD/DUF883 family membrane-anchored ribosome-binding protein
MDMNGSRDMAEGAREAMRQVQDTVTDRIEGLRGYADTADHAIREFARERPMVAIACAVGLGFLIGRLASRV